jgi:putative oxidoreductase
LPAGCRPVTKTRREQQTDIVFLVARILFAAIFLASAFGHFANQKQMAEYAKAMGAPAPGLAVPVTGLMILVGGLMIVLGIWGDLGALLLVAFLLPTTFIMHAFWKMDKEADPQMAQLEQISFMKNLSLTGGALAFFWLFVEYGKDLPLTITGPLF